jgi:SNF2 family DNA or RNA helicase
MGAVYDADHQPQPVHCAPRIADLRAIIENATGKLLIFVPFTSILNMLYRELKEHTRAVVNGAVSAKDRARIFDAFQNDPNPRLLLADPASVAHGVDLFAAQTVVWYGPVDRNELYPQGNKRAHRPGQKHPVTVVQMMTTKLEAEIFRRLEANETLQGAFLKLVREGGL